MRTTVAIYARRGFGRWDAMPSGFPADKIDIQSTGGEINRLLRRPILLVVLKPKLKYYASGIVERKEGAGPTPSSVRASGG